MAKLGTFFMVLIAIQLVLLAYASPSETATELWSLVTNVNDWSTTTFILSLLGIAGTLGLVGVVIGTVFGFKTDFIIFAAAISGLLAFGVIIAQLYVTMQAEMMPAFGCTPGNPCAPVDWILWLLVSPMAVYYVWTVVDWWRGRDS